MVPTDFASVLIALCVLELTVGTPCGQQFPVRLSLRARLIDESALLLQFFLSLRRAKHFWMSVELSNVQVDFGRPREF